MSDDLAVKVRYRLGATKQHAWEWANTRKSYWHTSGSWILSTTICRNFHALAVEYRKIPLPVLGAIGYNERREEFFLEKCCIDRCIYAHTKSDVRSGEVLPESEWQTLVSHLNAVSIGAQAFAEEFGAGELAFTAGLLHDIGKASEDFQLPSPTPPKQRIVATTQYTWPSRAAMRGLDFPTI